MRDFYLNDNNVVNRLVEEWNKYGKIIIAYDFDNTVYDYNNKGYTYNYVIELLQECSELGAYYVVFTSCEEDKFSFIKEYLKEKKIPFDKINENIDMIPFKGRKIYYNILLDDRAGLKSAHDNLRITLGNIYLDKAITEYDNSLLSFDTIIKQLNKYKINTMIEVATQRLERLYRRDLIFNSSKKIQMLEIICKLLKSNNVAITSLQRLKK
jgi:hypothetical protein